MDNKDSNGKLTDSDVANLEPKTKPYDVSDTGCKGLVLRVERSGKKSWGMYLYTPDRSQRYRWRLGDAATFRLYSNTPSRKADRERSIRDFAEATRARSLTVDLRAERRAAMVSADTKLVLTLRGYIDNRYLDYYRSEGYSRPDETMSAIKNAFPSLLDKRLDSITYMTINTWQNNAVKKRANATVSRLLQTLSGILTHAVGTEVLTKHPLQAKERNRKATRIKLVKPPRIPRRRYLSDEEEVRLRDTLKARDKALIAARLRTVKHYESRNAKSPKAINGCYFDHLTPIVLLALQTGIRRAAILGLRWEHIHDGQIHVSEILDKARKGYEVALSDEAKEILRKWKHQTGGKGLVFTYQGKQIKSIKSGWSKILCDAKITGFRFHDCRHSFASKLVTAGVPLYTVSQLLGHASIEMTMRYAHLSPDHMADALKALNS